MKATELLIETPVTPIIIAILAGAKVAIPAGRRGLVWLQNVVKKNFNKPVKISDQQAKQLDDTLKRAETQARNKDRYEANVRVGEYMDQGKAELADKNLKQEIANALKQLKDIKDNVKNENLDPIAKRQLDQQKQKFANEYTIWADWLAKATDDTVQPELKATSPAFNKDMAQEKRLLDRQAKDLIRQGEGDFVASVINGAKVPNIQADPVAGLQQRKVK